ncbi:hypothetical protein GH714_041362 [Hevea brasiliensis]|uniref:Uncharacterized protein n=1 Tax=Hevea brasiliensis TaxID=3981 RepID=A0A6A6MZK1_HEVBR|nr:hypothetical protein GH714_041362 [Hevea brasiliensis]
MGFSRIRQLSEGNLEIERQIAKLQVLEFVIFIWGVKSTLRSSADRRCLEQHKEENDLGPMALELDLIMHAAAHALRYYPLLFYVQTFGPKDFS